MRAADLDLIFVPERGSFDPGHWQSRWLAKLSSARFAIGDAEPLTAEAVARAASAAEKPIFFVAYSLGAVAVANAATALGGRNIVGALLVAPPDLRALATLDGGRWAAPHRKTLPFPSTLVASRTDPWAHYGESETLARDWGAELIDAGESGRIDQASGHGPWPEGLLRLAGMLKKL